MPFLSRPAELVRQAIGMSQCVSHQPMGASMTGVAVQVDLHAARPVIVGCRLGLVGIVLVAVMTEVRRIRGGLLVRAVRRRHSPGGLQREEAQQDDGDKPTHGARFYGEMNGCGFVGKESPAGRG